MAANGYPGDIVRNTEIKLNQADMEPDTKVFHAGTARDERGRLVNTGGRVLGVTALGDTVRDAWRRAYVAIDKIDWPEGFCRSDIGWRALEAEQENRNTSVS